MGVLLWAFAGLVLMSASGKPVPAQQVPSSPSTMPADPQDLGGEVPTGIPNMPDIDPELSVPPSPQPDPERAPDAATSAPSPAIAAGGPAAADPAVCDDLARIFFSLPKERRIAYASTLQECIENSIRQSAGLGESGPAS